MTTNYTDETTNIEYFGIATYEEVNDLIGQNFFPENEFNRGLSKNVADTCNLIKYTDTDTDGGKLLRYDSIELAQKTITLRIVNMSNDYTLYIHSFSFAFKDNITGVEHTEKSVDNTTITIEQGDQTRLTIKNYRDMAIPDIGAPLNVTLTLKLKYQFYSYYPQFSLPTESGVEFVGTGGTKIKTNLRKNAYGEFEITGKTLTDSGYWTNVTGYNRFDYITEEINTCWPSAATMISYAIYPNKLI